MDGYDYSLFDQIDDSVREHFGVYAKLFMVREF